MASAPCPAPCRPGGGSFCPPGQISGPVDGLPSRPVSVPFWHAALPVQYTALRFDCPRLIGRRASRCVTLT